MCHLCPLTFNAGMLAIQWYCYVHVHALNLVCIAIVHRELSCYITNNIWNELARLVLGTIFLVICIYSETSQQASLEGAHVTFAEILTAFRI